MNASEFKAWLLRNVGKGGSRPKTDPFNRQLKGNERNPSASEYASKDVQEYNHYAENQDLRKKDDDQQDESSQQQQQQQQGSQNAMSSKAGGQVAKSVARSLVSKVALVVVGSVTVVTSYNVIKEKNVAASTVASVSWAWNEDHSDATLSLLNKDGILIRHVGSTITSAETPATCDKDGQLIFTATATDQDQTYTDQQSVVLAALGHALNDGEEILIDGDPALRYECTRCHKDFVVTIPPGGFDPSKPKLLSHWDWNEDHTHCHVEFIDMDGHYVKTEEAAITVTTVEPTCVEDGLRTYTATVHEGDYDYNNIYREVIHSPGHIWEEDWTIDVPPTCTEAGSKSHHCENCDEIKDSTVIGALGHDFDEGTKQLIDGKPAIVYTCSRCGETFTIIIDEKEVPTPRYEAQWIWNEDYSACTVKLIDPDDGHIVKEDSAEVKLVSTVDPTCTMAGAKQYEATYVDGWDIYSGIGTQVLPALGHDFDEGTPTTIEGDPAIKYECSRCHKEFTIKIQIEEE